MRLAKQVSRRVKVEVNAAFELDYTLAGIQNQLSLMPAIDLRGIVARSCLFRALLFTSERER
jgi:hypothetical protein